MDWENDPELRKIRQEFTDSLPPRAVALRELARRFSSGNDAREDLQFLAHKLAGVAESYGYVMLTRVSELLDDRLDTEWNPGNQSLSELCTFLAEALDEAAATGKDQPDRLNDPRYRRAVG